MNNYFSTGEAVVPTDGLLGYITNVSIVHNLETNEGVLEGGNASAGTGEVIPKVIEVTLDFKALHEHHLGWEYGTRTGEDSAEGLSVFNKGDVFPYGADFDEGGPQITQRETQAAEERAARDRATADDAAAAAAVEADRAEMAQFSALAMALADPAQAAGFATGPLDDLLGFEGFEAAGEATTLDFSSMVPPISVGVTTDLNGLPLRAGDLRYDSTTLLGWTMGTTPTATQATSDETAADLGTWLLAYSEGTSE